MLHFTKMHALGNDFMFVDARVKPFTLTSSQIAALADRHKGVGFDQLLCLEVPEQPDFDGKYRIFNADGSEVGQCGNGARCVAHYLYLHGKAKTSAVSLESMAGTITVTPAKIETTLIGFGDEAYYRAALAIPSFLPAQIPVHTVETDRLPWLTWIDEVDLAGRSYQGVVVGVGNPHWIIPMQAFDATCLQHIGECLNHMASGLFPEGVNISQLRVDSRQILTIATYERGVGITLACGSAAAAAAVVAISQGWCDNSVRINMTGGHLAVDWAGVGEPVFITGPAVSVFQGELIL